VTNQAAQPGGWQAESLTAIRRRGAKEYKMSNHQSGSKAITGLVVIFVVLLAWLATMFLIATLSVA
jgi:hypothetical protein